MRGVSFPNCFNSTVSLFDWYKFLEKQNMQKLLLNKPEVLLSSVYFVCFIRPKKKHAINKFKYKTSSRYHQKSYWLEFEVLIFEVSSVKVCLNEAVLSFMVFRFFTDLKCGNYFNDPLLNRTWMQNYSLSQNIVNNLKLSPFSSAHLMNIFEIDCIRGRTYWFLANNGKNDDISRITQ